MSFSDLCKTATCRAEEDGGCQTLKSRIAATSYLGTAIHAIEAEGLKLQANTIIDRQVFREGDSVDVGFAPSDCVLLGEDDRRLV